MLQDFLIELRVAAIRLVHRQNVRLPTETADALAASNKIGNISGLGALQFLLGRACRKQPGNLLVHAFLDSRHVITGPGRGHNPELTADLTPINESGHVSRALVVIDQPLVKSGGLAGSEGAADQFQVARVRFSVRRHVPHLE